MSNFCAANAEVSSWAESLFWGEKVSKIKNLVSLEGAELKSPFPAVFFFSCYGISAAFAFIIGCNYISHRPAHTFILTSLSQINSVSAMIEINLDDCYKTWDLRWLNIACAPSLPLLPSLHFISHHLPLFVAAIFVPISTPSPHLFLQVRLCRFLPVCPRIAHSISPAKPESERCTGSMYMWIMEEAGFALTRCVWWLTSALRFGVCVRVCVSVCGQGVLPFRSSIIQRQTFFRLYRKNLSDGSAWDSKVLIDDCPHMNTGTNTSEQQNAQQIHVKTRLDWHDMAWLNSFVAFLHHLCSHIRDDWHFFFQSRRMTVYIRTSE